MNLIEAKNLSKCYNLKAKQKIYAVNHIDLSIRKGEILGLVGESGCGKSTLGKLLLKLERASSGSVTFKGQDISHLSFEVMRPLRRNMQMIFQNSANVFNPFFTVRQIIMEPLNNYVRGSTKDKEIRIIEVLERVGLSEDYLSRYGSELSGGQRQRVGIARALVLKPEFVVCDEPVSSVDYAIRNQILNLLLELKEQFGLTYLFISHALSVVNKICDRVVVMYLGNILEILPSMNQNVIHPYTQALLAATLDVNPRNRGRKKVLLEKNEESSIPNQGCVFQNRCLYTEKICKKQKPSLEMVENSGDHLVACHLCK